MADDRGVDELITLIIEQCIELEDKVVGTSGTAKTGGAESIFTLGGSDGLTSGDIKNINPMKLQVKKKNRGCCGAD